MLAAVLDLGCARVSRRADDNGGTPVKSSGSAASSSRLKRRAVLVPAFVATVTGLSGVAVAAFADDTGFYDPVALETSCVQNVDGLGQADRCRFEPWTKENFTGDIKQVSSSTANCTDTATTKIVDWSQATTETNSIEVSVSVKATLSKIYEVSITATYGHTWSFTNTETNKETIPLKPFHIGWVDRGAPMQRVTGRMVINYPKRRHGHFEWYTYPTLTAADPQARGFETFILQSRPMTAAEIDGICKSRPAASTAGVDDAEGAGPESASDTPGEPTSTVLRQADPPQTTVTVPDGDTSIERADD
jgi:hypothetical protein